MIANCNKYEFTTQRSRSGLQKDNNRDFLLAHMHKIKHRYVRRIMHKLL